MKNLTLMDYEKPKIKVIEINVENAILTTSGGNQAVENGEIQDLGDWTMWGE